MTPVFRIYILQVDDNTQQFTMANFVLCIANRKKYAYSTLDKFDKFIDRNGVLGDGIYKWQTKAKNMDQYMSNDRIPKIIAISDKNKYQFIGIGRSALLDGKRESFISRIDWIDIRQYKITNKHDLLNILNLCIQTQYKPSYFNTRGIIPCGFIERHIQDTAVYREFVTKYNTLIQSF